MALEIIFKGEDKTIEITVTDADDQVIDLDTASEIIVRILDESGNSIEEYNKAGGGDFRALDIPNPSLGIMNLFLNAAETDVAALGSVDVEIKMRFSDTDFDGDVADAVTTIKSIAEIENSATILDL